MTLRVIRLLDIFLSLIGLLIFGPIILAAVFLVWICDLKSPIFIGRRVGAHGKEFGMVKIRSMHRNAHLSGVDSTSANDQRITKIGGILRKIKFDEITQLWNVLIGDMSIIGPRPNVAWDVASYSIEERRLLEVRPGISDIASIVFADESEILKNSKDPDLDYCRLIRPWKNMLGLIWVDNYTVSLYFRIIILTLTSLISRRTSLQLLSILVTKISGNSLLTEICKRDAPLYPTAPPGKQYSISKSEFVRLKANIP